MACANIATAIAPISGAVYTSSIILCSRFTFKSDLSSPKFFIYFHIPQVCVTCNPEICVNLVFKHIYDASSYAIYKQFVHSFIVLCENEYFLISNLY